MTVTVITPKGDGIKTGSGTKVVDDKSGMEISGISRFAIEYTPDGLIEAVIRIPVSKTLTDE